MKKLILEIERIFSENKVDYVVNFAAESHVDRFIENPQIFLETNILGTQNLIVIAYGEAYKLPINITRCSNITNLNIFQKNWYLKGLNTNISNINYNLITYV